MWDVYVSGNFEMIVAAYNALAMMFCTVITSTTGQRFLRCSNCSLPRCKRWVDDQTKTGSQLLLWPHHFYHSSLAHRRGSRC